MAGRRGEGEEANRRGEGEAWRGREERARWRGREERARWRGREERARKGREGEVARKEGEGEEGRKNRIQLLISVDTFNTSPVYNTEKTSEGNYIFKHLTYIYICRYIYINISEKCVYLSLT